VAFDLPADVFDRSVVGAKETAGECLVLAQEAQQQVFGLDVGLPELAGLISCEEDHATCFLGVLFKHTGKHSCFCSRCYMGRAHSIVSSNLLPEFA
jgi:hypothetical protein